jgi:NADH dehydrogenase
VFIEDVAAVFMRSLEDLASAGKSYDLCGPKAYTLRELVEYVGSVTGHSRWVVGLNDTLSYLQAWALEFSPVKLLTRDNYRSMKVDSVCACAFPFGMNPTALEAVAPTWLATDTPRAQYQRFRVRARR